MIRICGNGVSTGVAAGPMYFFRRSVEEVTRSRAESMDAEMERFAQARAMSVRQLEELAEKCREASGDEASVLFEAHAMFVEDIEYVELVTAFLQKDQCNAEYAVWLAGEQLSEMFASMEDDYMKARATDIRDVTRRILDNLAGAGVAEGGIESNGPVILASDDLTPSETLQLDRSRVLGFVTRGGSENSHTAILARTMGIPAVCGLGGSLKQEYEGKQVYLDGETGEVFVEPDEPTRKALLEKERSQREQRERMESLKGQEAAPEGGVLTVCGNIDLPEDVDAVLAGGGQGIGLFRSEYLYLAARDYPTEEEQFEAYRSVLSAMEGKRVVVRTLDIGADKQADYFHLQKEENPAMGLRGIRLCFERPEIFRTQLRALYRASAFGRLAILFPMITSVWEVEECRIHCERVRNELDREGIPFDPDTEIGIMIETPAAVFLAAELAKQVDFFSVGTNDLTQYMLACDRHSGDPGRLFDPHHPAVLRALRLTADAAHGEGIRIAVCGELAADLSMLPLFLDIGIDELSVSPASILPLCAAIRESAAADGETAQAVR